MPRPRRSKPRSKRTPPAEAPAAKAQPAKADPAALAANLLIALNGSIPGAAPAQTSGKPVPAKPEAEGSPSDTAETGEIAAAVPTTNWAAIVAAAIPAAASPTAAKPAKPAEATAAPADTSTPALPVAARPRDAAMPILPGAEAPVAKPVEAAPSMTILFAQPAAQSAATLAEAAAPAVIAERVLDMESDGAWIDQLARDIAATKSDSGDISFRLMPKHLGRLDVAMQMGDEGVSLKMDTRHEATATIVTAAQGRLVEELRQQGRARRRRRSDLHAGRDRTPVAKPGPGSGPHRRSRPHASYRNRHRTRRAA
jgi:flagellar hook-length control protein FliK